MRSPAGVDSTICVLCIYTQDTSPSPAGSRRSSPHTGYKKLIVKKKLFLFFITGIIAGFTCCRISWFPNTWKSVSSLYLSPSRRHCLASSSLTVRGWKCQAEWWKQSLLRVSAPPTHKTHRETHFKLDATAVDSEEKLNCHHCKNPWEHDKKIYILWSIISFLCIYYLIYRPSKIQTD